MERKVLARSAGSDGDLVLSQMPDGRLELRAGGVFVMDDSETLSEQRLAALALEHSADPRTVLIGGLGLGYTARAVLTDPRVARLVIAEVEAELVEWTSEDLVPGGAALMADPRVEVVVGDVRDRLGMPHERYDVILLDVDNGPDFLVRPENSTLYEARVLSRCAQSLTPGGVLVVWSASRSAQLEINLRGAFKTVEVETVAVTPGRRREEHWLYLGREPRNIGL